MKKFYYRNLAYGAAALLIGAVGFTGCSSEDELANTNPTYDGKSVKTQFAINIPYGSANTRMTGDNTQESGNFLGMYNIKLIPMTTTGADETGFTSILSLDNIATSGLEDTFRKVYSDVNVPVGTTNFLFYGAGGTDVASTPNEMFNEGIIESNVKGGSTSEISFSLKAAKGTDTNSECQKLVKVLDKVVNVTGWSTQAEETDLKKLYDNFITLKAGSANSICKTLETLYNQVEGLKTSTDETVKDIASNIQEAIKTDNVFTVSDGNSPYTLTTQLTYPQNMNMPDGSASVSFVEKSGNVDAHFDAKESGVSNANMTIKMDDICYPASIYYIANTPLKATNSDNVAWPATLDAWTGTGSFPAPEWGDAVLATTRTIALKNAIQYAVAKLALTVKCGATSLEDNAESYITVPNEGFEVTGVLIGGQPTSAKWDFTPNGEEATLTKTVYDNNVVSGMAAKYNEKSSTNYTLVLDNKMTTAQRVNIAIELKNTSTSDFKGVDGVVPAGGTFYLIAQLDPSAQNGIKKPEGVDNPWVFMQDYKTEANLTITSLKNAYNVIPDLRASQLSLGLAVDLTWKTGIAFDVEIQ